MAASPVRISTTQYLHTLGVIDKSAAQSGFDYDVTVAKSIDEATLRMLAGDFDAGECSFATYLQICQRDQATGQRFVALPVFAKKLVAQYAFCRDNDTLDGHGSLAGKRIAVPQFWVTAAIWHRWFMAQAGVDAANVTWCPLGKDRIDGMPYPDALKFDWSLAGKKPADLLRDGAVDCFIYARRPDDMRGLRYLSRRPIDATLSQARDSGVVPVTHVLIVRRDRIAAEPQLARSLFDLFNASFKAAEREAGNHIAQYLPLGDLQLDAVSAMLGAGWNGHGWTRNEKAMRTFLGAAIDQGFVSKLQLEDLFVKLD
jgi:4,5-dihydroxyphthalate decarboxylase